MASVSADCPNRSHRFFAEKNQLNAGYHIRMNRLLGIAITILVMLALKQHYSTASAGQLTWILEPTARLTAWLIHSDPVWEPGTGYVDFSRGIIIAPVCAGVNFMIMAFGLAACCGLIRIRKLPQLLIYLALSLAGAYLLAVMVNALRIVLSIALYRADFYTTWLTPAGVHRLAGISIYLSALGLYFTGLRPIINGYCRRFDHQMPAPKALLPSWLPPVWYLAGAVGVPSANLLFRGPSPGFAEHCAVVVISVLVIWGGVSGIRRLINER